MALSALYQHVMIGFQLQSLAIIVVDRKQTHKHIKTSDFLYQMVDVYFTLADPTTGKFSFECVHTSLNSTTSFNISTVNSLNVCKVPDQTNMCGSIYQK